MTNYPLFQALFHFVYAGLVAGVGITLVRIAAAEHNRQIRYLGLGVILVAIDYAIEGVSFGIVRYVPEVSGVLSNIISQLFLHAGLTVILLPAVMLQLKLDYKFALIPLLSGCIAAAIDVFSFTLPTISEVGLVAWHRHSVSQFITLVTTFAIGIVVGFLFFFSLGQQGRRISWRMTIIGLAIALVSLTGRFLIINENPVFFFPLNIIHVFGWSTILLMITVFRPATFTPTLKEKLQDSH